MKVFDVIAIVTDPVIDVVLPEDLIVDLVVPESPATEEAGMV